MLGDDDTARKWSVHFYRMDEVLLEDISIVWPSLVRDLPSDSAETRINSNLVQRLRKHKKTKNHYHAIYSIHAPFPATNKDAKGLIVERGLIDFAIVLIEDYEQYLACECKRLNVLYGTKLYSMAGKYIEKGVMRFISRKYSDEQPIGCMLGYVMDGNIDSAKESIWTAFQGARGADTALDGEPVMMAKINEITRFSTTHFRRKDEKFEIRHALLSFKKMQNT